MIADTVIYGVLQACGVLGAATTACHSQLKGWP